MLFHHLYVLKQLFIIKKKLDNCWRTTQNTAAGHFWPAGSVLGAPALMQPRSARRRSADDTVLTLRLKS